MKKILIFALALFTLVSCSKNEDEIENSVLQKFIGKWNYVEYIDDVPELDNNGNPIPVYITNGYNLELKENGTFLSDEEIGYTGGNYSIINDANGDNIKLTYSNSENQLISYKGIVRIENEDLMLTFSTNYAQNLSLQIVFYQRLHKIISSQTKIFIKS